MEELEKVLKLVCQLGQVSSGVFREFREKQDHIRTLLKQTVMEIKTIYAVQDELTAAEMAKKGAVESAKKHSVFKKTTEIEIDQLVDCSHYNTMCLTHVNQFVCHEHCSLEETTTPGSNEIFGRCFCMGGGNVCKVCGCGPDVHVHQRKTLKKIKKPVEEIMHDIKAQFELHSNQQVQLTKKITDFQKNMRTLKTALQEKEDKIKDYCRQLQGICKLYNFVDATKASIAMMEMDARSITSLDAREAADDMIKRIKMLVNHLSQGMDND